MPALGRFSAMMFDRAHSASLRSPYSARMCVPCAPNCFRFLRRRVTSGWRATAVVLALAHNRPALVHVPVHSQAPASTMIKLNRSLSRVHAVRPTVPRATCSCVGCVVADAAAVTVFVPSSVCVSPSPSSPMLLVAVVS